MGPKIQQDKLAWQWADTTDPDDIRDEHLETAYRIKLKACNRLPGQSVFAPVVLVNLSMAENGVALFWVLLEHGWAAASTATSSSSSVQSLKQENASYFSAGIARVIHTALLDWAKKNGFLKSRRAVSMMWTIQRKNAGRKELLWVSRI